MGVDLSTMNPFQDTFIDLPLRFQNSVLYIFNSENNNTGLLHLQNIFIKHFLMVSVFQQQRFLGIAQMLYRNFPSYIYIHLRRLFGGSSMQR